MENNYIRIHSIKARRTGGRVLPYVENGKRLNLVQKRNEILATLWVLLPTREGSSLRIGEV